MNITKNKVIATKEVDMIKNKNDMNQNIMNEIIGFKTTEVRL